MDNEHNIETYSVCKIPFSLDARYEFSLFVVVPLRSMGP